MIKTMSSRRTSVLWNFFNPIEGDKQTALCRICGIALSYKSTVTNLKKHMVRKHPQVSVTTGAIDSLDEEYDEEQYKESNEVETEEEATTANPIEVKGQHDDSDIDESLPYEEIEFVDERSIQKGNTQSNQDTLANKSSKKSFSTPANSVPTEWVVTKKRKITSSPPSSPNYSGSGEARSKSGETEFDAWARSVAIQLNQMDICRALNLQMAIQSLITKERLSHSNKNK